MRLLCRLPPHAIEIVDIDARHSDGEVVRMRGDNLQLLSSEVQALASVYQQRKRGEGEGVKMRQFKED